VSWIGQDTAHSVSPSLQVLPTDYSVDIHQALQYSTAPGTITADFYTKHFVQATNCSLV